MHVSKPYFLLALLVLVSCAHHRDVRPGADGLHKVVVRGEDREQSERSALSQARHFCEERNLDAAIVTEKTDYKGSMDEGTRETIKRASDVATILGGTMKGRSRANPNDTEAGDVVQDAGRVGHAVTGGDDYLTEMTFKCK